MTPKRPLVESKRTLFLKNRHILTPKRESRLASKNNPFFTFSGRACVQQYNSIQYFQALVSNWSSNDSKYLVTVQKFVGQKKFFVISQKCSF